MWRVYPRHPEYFEYYRFQTTDPAVSKKIGKIRDKNGEKAVLVSNGVNTYHKVYELSLTRPSMALNVFKRVVGQKLKESGERGLFYAETPLILTS